MRAVPIVLLACALAAAARADVSVRAPVPAGPLAGGTPALVAAEGLPADVDEFELFLVPAPGARPLRLTESTSGETSVLVSVPNVALRGARFRIRVGEEGEERWAAESAPFDVHANPLLPAASVAMRRDEEWVLPATALPDSSAASRPRERFTERPGETGLLRPPTADPELPAKGALRENPAPAIASASGRVLRFDTGAFQVPLRR